ncbi:gliding motility-associated ABC transporter ATP-binding subunit GldA [Fluviicola sp.]|jgi:ABC-2 type transport system ATP-binding protein|uniref:gliding motility-associated ABC transporter ATP-binding subunit GldA n=1 Tax=Fluviicola sp. TaxID=1917219 RepID=UPI00282A9AD9|nr:gliding motility-associated ABC transporter ATP-binding subunit GldA [Fluviicola sp.]MDR0801094.1 gliding motility-associated ABC transporter ATP-binding subunit GldA [Fluviicola sp.]
MSIEVKNLSKYYGEQAAVNDITFSIGKGEIIGFLGPNGAGKSTTMKMITGFIPATEGSIHVCGIPVSVDSIETRKRIGYLPENNPLYLDMYVKEYLEFVGKIYKVKNLKERVKEMIQLVGLEVEQNKKIGMLSKGYRQRVGLAQAIIHNPDVLILDEPTSGLDPNQLVEIRELIKRIGKEKTVMLSTHILQEVEAICDRVIIIRKGQLVADNLASNLQVATDNTQVVYVEFDRIVAKNLLQKIPGVSKIERVSDSRYLIESQSVDDLRKIVAQFAQQHNLLILTLRTEEKSLEKVFKSLTK